MPANVKFQFKKNPYKLFSLLISNLFQLFLLFIFFHFLSKFVTYDECNRIDCHYTKNR